MQTARAAEAGGENAVAVGQYQKLYLKKPKDPEVLLGLARNLRYTGRIKEARVILLESSELGANEPAFILEFAKAEIAGGVPIKAVVRLNKARALDPKNWDVYSTLGIAYDMAEQFGEAKGAYDRALELSPENPAVINNMAISAALSGDLDRAIRTLEDSSLIVRKNSQVRQNLALLYGLKGDEGKSRSMSRISLDEESVKNNLAVYSKLRGGDLHSQD